MVKRKEAMGEKGKHDEAVALLRVVLVAGFFPPPSSPNLRITI